MLLRATPAPADDDVWRLLPATFVTTDDRGIVPSAETRRELDILMLRVATLRLRDSSPCGRIVLVFLMDLLSTEVRLVSKLFAVDILLFSLPAAVTAVDALREGALPGATGATRTGRRTETRAAVLFLGSECMEPREGGRSPPL